MESGEIRRHIGYLIKNINDRIKMKADAELKGHGLTLSQSRVIGFLKEHGNQAAQKEIEKYLDVAHPTLTGIVGRMERNGFVACRQNPRDRRSKIVALTEKALETGEELSALIDRQENTMLASLSEEEIAQLERTLRIILKNLQ